MLAGLSSLAQTPAPSRPPLLAPSDSLAPASPQTRFIPLPADTRPAGKLRAPQTARLRELSRQPEFQYAEPEAQEADNSLWTRFWKQVGRWILGLFSGPRYENGGRYVVYALFGGAFLYVLLRLLRLDLTGLFRRGSRTVPLPYDAAAENIHGVDFDAALAQAEAAGNYRLAVRLGYLLSLRELTERNLIQWQPNKTNHEYLRELSGTPWTASFRTLTHQFEFVWYGELGISEAEYPALRDARQQFIRQLSRAAA
ncbi:DUF4129 domain-containing protein [Hymenobacter tenuis]